MRTLARFKTMLIMVGAILGLSTFVLDNDLVFSVAVVLIVAGLGLMAVRQPRLAAATFAGRPLDAPVPQGVRVMRFPLRGRWVAVHSPADKVPSHGVDAYGQTYAVDLVHHDDEEHDWKGVHAWPPARPAAAFSGFGRPLYAPADGTVVRAAGWHRDHWSRNSWISVAYLLIEGAIRELGGPGFLFGNHVILDLGDGTYAAFAHLKRGSLRVRPGERVRAGDHLGDVGNSGNTSEPHLHFQLMDRARPLIATGVPFVFDRYESDDGRELRGVPGDYRPFTVADDAAPDRTAMSAEPRRSSPGTA